MPPHARTEKRDLGQVGGTGLRSAPPTPSPYPTPLHRGSSSSSSCATVGLDSPLPEDLGFSLHPDSYPTMPQRYTPPGTPRWRTMPVAGSARRRRVHCHQPVVRTIALNGVGHRCNQSCFSDF
ncbi:hypothetical protein SKAU_G00079610 [Synaphobranchus kaupii]|uniref:Uncharacterized protein n=1 Tax=Synaphobranchus kaupii TaxID=118154 RepID=A0A9Q1FVE3_SYNKA|nr:hypothetical protein SKAU_G00079610 [Synaphobranchus kaupii]